MFLLHRRRKPEQSLSPQWVRDNIASLTVQQEETLERWQGMLPPRPNVYTLWSPLVKVLPAEELAAARQQERNVFTERARLAGHALPDEQTLQRWWPGTKPMAGAS